LESIGQTGILEVMLRQGRFECQRPRVALLYLTIPRRIVSW
jgi:hypothetical protein